MSAEQIFNKARQENRTTLTEIESKELLKKAGIPVIETALATTKKDAVALSKKIGFPVVMKIASPDIIHKSDSGGVKLGLTNVTQVRRAYSEIMSSMKDKFPQSRVHGVAIQKMARPGIEVIVGLSKDAQFGPIIMFGLGGILVEVLEDVSFRLVPVTMKDAEEMIKEIRGYPLLRGYRGQEPVDISLLERFIVRVSRFAEIYPQVKELDINPIFAYADNALAVDARITLEAHEIGL